MRALAAAIIVLLGLVASAWAVNPDEMLADPALEARARAISAELRCLVCQNQSIDDSDADLAHDLRVVVRERLTAGDSDSEVLQYVVDRYGEFVLLRPVLAWHTIALWIAAPLMLIVGCVALVVFAVRRRPLRELGTDGELSAEEEAALASLEAPQGPGQPAAGSKSSDRKVTP
jgi:cytochrome c-type biogenesis protein CcmH